MICCVGLGRGLVYRKMRIKKFRDSLRNDENDLKLVVAMAI